MGRKLLENENLTNGKRGYVFGRKDIKMDAL
jgi:hypothetical protein